MSSCRWWCLGLVALLAAGSFGLARQPRPALYQDENKPQPPMIFPDPPPVPPAADGSLALDAPLRLLDEARQTYQGVRDYTCVLIKRERLRGRLQPDQVILMRARPQPFSMDLRWQEPRSLAGQEACYVAGRNNNMMRVHTTGLSGVMGFISLDPRDPRALEHSRHTITEAGVGHLIDTLGQAWQDERRLNVTEVHLGDFEFNHRLCTRVETLHPPGGGRFAFYRTLVYFDKQTHLPIRVENYDWPHQRGSTQGELVEVYSYVDLTLNGGLTEDVFDH